VIGSAAFWVEIGREEGRRMGTEGVEEEEVGRRDSPGFHIIFAEKWSR